MVRTILFVCVGNAGRSQMAEAIFNRLAPSGFRGISAGTMPAKEVNPLAIEALRQIGVDASGYKPKLVSPDMVREAERIVTMGCEASNFCPAKFLPKVEDWNIEDPKDKTLQQIISIRETIRERVEGLIRELQSTQT